VVKPSYHLSAEGEPMYHRLVLELIKKFKVRRVCDVGGGAHPTLSLAEVRSLNLEYTLLDISAVELAKAPHGYVTLQADINEQIERVPTGFDLVVSTMLAEHVRNGETFHRNVRGILRPDGIACHFFPTLYALPLLINSWIPERLSSWLLHWFNPVDAYHLKFPAYYRWCRGPSRAQIRRLEALGYTVLNYYGFFGHDYYLRVPLLKTLHAALARFLIAHPVPQWTSRALVVLQRQGA
jgi:2-polyprenyl-3-methyl-5-hydroxy-6-metoxy-1,4-benzoquinol methylase